MTNFLIAIPDPSLPALSVTVGKPLTDERREFHAARYAAQQPRHLRNRAKAAALEALTRVDATDKGFFIRHPGHNPDDVPLPAVDPRA